MSERMHPEDARREIVMEFYKIATLSPDLETRDECIAWAIDSAEKLLAELERTAKPGPDPYTVMLPIPKAATNARYVLDGKEYEVGGPGEPAQVRPSARCARSHPHDNPCKDHDLLTELARANNQLANAEARADHFNGRAERAETALDAIAQIINGATKPVLPTELVKQAVLLKTELEWMKEQKAEGEKLQGESNLKIQELETENRRQARALLGSGLISMQARLDASEARVSQQAAEIVELKAHLSAADLALRKATNDR